MSQEVSLKPRCWRVTAEEVVIVSEQHPCACGSCEGCDPLWDVDGHQVGNIAAFDRRLDGTWLRCYYRVAPDGSATLITQRLMRQG